MNPILLILAGRFDAANTLVALPYSSFTNEGRCNTYSGAERTIATGGGYIHLTNISNISNKLQDHDFIDTQPNEIWLLNADKAIEINIH